MDAALQRSLVDWAAAHVEDGDLVDVIAGIDVFVEWNPKVIADGRTWYEIRYDAERAGAVRKSSLTPEEAISFREFLVRQPTATLRFLLKNPRNNPDEIRVLTEVMTGRGEQP